MVLRRPRVFLRVWFSSARPSRRRASSCATAVARLPRAVALTPPQTPAQPPSRPTPPGCASLSLPPVPSNRPSLAPATTIPRRRQALDKSRIRQGRPSPPKPPCFAWTAAVTTWDGPAAAQMSRAADAGPWLREFERDRVRHVREWVHMVVRLHRRTPPPNPASSSSTPLAARAPFELRSGGRRRRDGEGRRGRRRSHGGMDAVQRQLMFEDETTAVRGEEIILWFFVFRACTQCLASEFRIPYQQVRGILHLLGFHHETSDEATSKMEKEEQVILKSLRLRRARTLTLQTLLEMMIFGFAKEQFQFLRLSKDFLMLLNQKLLSALPQI